MPSPAPLPRLPFDRRVAALAVAALGIAFFAFVVSAPLDLVPKVLFALFDLVIVGLLLRRMMGWDGFSGVIMLKGTRGFDAMQWVAKRHPRFSTFAADAGLGVCLGLPYAAWVFRNRAGRFLSIALLTTAFFAFLLQGVSAPFAPQAAALFASALALGFLGMGAFFIFSHALNVLTIPNTPPGLAPVIPGVTPGIPLLEGLIAIGIIAAVHELAHGVLARVEKLPLKSSGVLLLGFLPIGAFVEPDEEKFKKLDIHAKRRILVAGSASNTLFFLAFLALSALVVLATPLAASGVLASVPANSSLAGLVPNQSIVTAVNGQPVTSTLDAGRALGNATAATLAFNGASLDVALRDVFVVRVFPDSRNADALPAGTRVESLDGKPLRGIADLQAALAGKREGDVVHAETGGGPRALVLGPGGKIGAEFAERPAVLLRNEPLPGFAWLLGLLEFLAGLFALTAFLNFALALFNVLPVFITDGHRLLYEEFSRHFGRGDGNKARVLANLLGALTLLAILVNLAPWILRG